METKIAKMTEDHNAVDGAVVAVDGLSASLRVMREVHDAIFLAREQFKLPEESELPEWPGRGDEPPIRYSESIERLKHLSRLLQELDEGLRWLENDEQYWGEIMRGLYAKRAKLAAGSTPTRVNRKSSVA